VQIFFKDDLSKVVVYRRSISSGLHIVERLLRQFTCWYPTVLDALLGFYRSIAGRSRLKKAIADESLLVSVIICDRWNRNLIF